MAIASIAPMLDSEGKIIIAQTDTSDLVYFSHCNSLKTRIRIIKIEERKKAPKLDLPFRYGGKIIEANKKKMETVDSVKNLGIVSTARS